ncbi:lamin tail domain-containing protein [Streptomyces sp. NPDC018610]|uniref:lamin tail domain-containing protein n=1 Tax=Streptomyces sp. NPDC018610 TaxID=3365049 RepID=UPI0037BDF4C5
MSVSVSVTARRLTAAAAAAGALVGMATLPASAADHAPHSNRQGVVIAGAHLDNAAGAHRSNRSLNNEWVTITNNGRRDVNLNGWTLSDRQGHTYTFRHYRLGGHATVRVHTGYGHDTRTDLYQDRRSSVWDKHADTATLRDADHRYVDSAAWGGGRHADRPGPRHAERPGPRHDDRHDGRHEGRHEGRHDDRHNDRHDDRH